MKQKIILKINKKICIKENFYIAKYATYQTVFSNYIEKQKSKGLVISEIYVPYILQYPFAYLSMSKFLEAQKISLHILDRSSLKIIIKCSCKESVEKILLKEGYNQ